MRKYIARFQAEHSLWKFKPFDLITLAQHQATGDARLFKK